jgi:hypothetical protein
MNENFEKPPVVLVHDPSPAAVCLLFVLVKVTADVVLYSEWKAFFLFPTIKL